MKGKNLQPAISLPSQDSHGNLTGIKSSTENQKQTGFSITVLALQTNTKGTSLGRKKPLLEKKENYEWKSFPIKTSKGKVGNH